MPAAYADLINRNVLQIPQRGPGVPPLQVFLLEILDQIPADLQVPRHVLNRHRVCEFQGVPGKLPGVPLVRVGKAHVHLPRGVATTLAIRQARPSSSI